MKYILWGMGVDAERFYYQYGEKIEILFCVDRNHEKMQGFHGLEVRSPEAVENIKAKILIASSQYYKEIKGFLEEKGFEEYVDFVYCFDFDKKLVLIHGNCHCRVIRHYLQTSTSFNSEYTFGDWPYLYEDREFDERLLQKCDVFIHQDIQAGNGKGYQVSDEYLLPKLKEDCKEICIPNLYGFPKALFYTQSTINQKGGKIGNRDNPFYYAEDMIDKLHMEMLLDIPNIIKILTSQFINPDIIKKQWKDDFEKWGKREENWDVKILDFIKNNYKENQLFFDIGHPSNFILKEISNRVLKKLNIEDLCLDLKINPVFDLNWELDAHEVPIYPCISKALGLKWTQTYLRKNSFEKVILGNCDMDIQEYVKEYIYWSYYKDSPIDKR